MKRVLFPILALVLAFGLALPMAAAPVMAAGTEVIWDIGTEGDGRQEFNHDAFDGIDTATYDVGVDSASDFPAFLYISGYTGSWEEEGVHQITINFTLSKGYSDVTLKYIKYGGETDDISLDGVLKQTVTGPGENTVGTYYVSLGDLSYGPHSIVIVCVGKGTGEGAHTYDYFALTTPTWDVTVNAEEDSNSLAVPIGWAWDGSNSSNTTSFTVGDILDSSSLTLTAPATHDEGYTFYVFDHWSVNGGSTGEAAVTFEVTEDLTATAHYTKVMSVDKELTYCWHEDLQLVDTVIVAANSTSGATTTATLDSGKTYWFKASGTAFAGDTIDFDAKYSITHRIIGDTWTDNVSGYESNGPTLLDLQVDGVSPDWGDYNDAHTYWTSQAGTGAPVEFTFSIYDIYYPNNTGSLMVEVYECDPDAVPLQTEVSFGMTITVHAWEAVTNIYVEDGIGADLMVDSYSASSGNATDWKAGKGKRGATKIGWTIDAPVVCEDYTLDIDVHTRLNPKNKQEYTSTGEHELNSGPEVYFTYNGELYMMQGPPVMVTVVGDED